MKSLYLVFFVSLLNVSNLNAYALTLVNHHHDTTIQRVERLKHLYFLSITSPADESVNYKQQFFDEFPNTFKEFNEIYGYTSDKYGLLYLAAPKHILDLFNKLDNINDTLYFRKIISIGIGGKWDADAVNYYQHGLRNRIQTNPQLAVVILNNLPDKKIRNFWHFYFDGPHPKKQLPMPLQEIKTIDIRIYNLLIEAQTEVLKEWSR